MRSIIIGGGDEAGRGAVLGPLVVSIVCIGSAKEKRLRDIGVRDSKMLTGKKREFLYEEIRSLASEVAYRSITNEEINAAMRSNISLNELEALHFAKLVDSLNTDIKKLYIDSPDVIQGRFGTRIGLFAKKTVASVGVKCKDGHVIRITAEHKADIRYPVVSASSIISKVIRDREVGRIADASGIDIGSGYPSDMQTIRALKADLHEKRLEPYVRNRWKTWSSIRQHRMDEFLGR